jgi:hypothetical protein
VLMPPPSFAALLSPPHAVSVPIARAEATKTSTKKRIVLVVTCVIPRCIIVMLLPSLSIVGGLPL